MSRFIHTVLAVTAAAAIGTPAQAINFVEALDAARQHDAQFRAAGHELESARQAVPMARAALLPQIGLSASGSDVVGSRQFPNSLNQDVRLRVEYATPQASLQLRMPIFNAEARSRVDQTRAQTDVAESVYRYRGLELVDRLATAYLQVLLANEGKALAQTQLAALQVQLAQVKQRLERGEGTRVEVAQTQANLDVVKVRLVEAEDQVVLTRRQLKRMTGMDDVPLSGLPADEVLPPLQPQGLREWIDLALLQSPTLAAREQALVAAKMGVKRNFAGHLPKLDLVASLTQSQNESISSLNQTSTLRSIGVQLNVPIYSGGGVDAGVKQALADQARVEEEVRTERETIEIEIHKQYQTVASGQARISAYRQSVASAELLLQGMKRSLEAGLGTQNDVADALARVFLARRDLAQARVEYMLARARLMLQAGMSSADVAADVDRSLVAAAQATAPRSQP